MVWNDAELITIEPPLFYFHSLAFFIQKNKQENKKKKPLKIAL